MEILPEFKMLGLSDETIRALQEKGFTSPTEIQKLCIPLLLKEDTEVIGQAQTGTGKTAAFGLPIIETLEGGGNLEALILCPTRELAIQVSEEIRSLEGKKNLIVEAVYGGASIEMQIKKLKKGVDVVVGTPGRILDHIRRNTIRLSALKFCVLDEADEMLDMGFIEDIEAILAQTPENKRMLMFSATMPKMVLSIAEKFMHDYQLIRTEKKDTSCRMTRQIAYIVKESEKLEALTRIIDSEAYFYGVIFCRTKIQCEEIAERLIHRGYGASALHGDLSQRERETILKGIKEHRSEILVATDVASRGLDIQELSHVVNFSVPDDPEIYIHRVGRTGRAGHEGIAITLCGPRETRKLAFIERTTSSKIERLEVPAIRQVLAAKKEKIVMDLKKKLSADAQKEYLVIAMEALETTKDPLAAFACLIQALYGNQLDEKLYAEISSGKDKKKESKKEKPVFGERKEDEELTRIFIARGKRDGVTKRSLAGILCDQVGLRDAELHNIEVLDDFSFVSAAEPVAKKVLKYFSVPKGKGKPIATRAKEERHQANRKSRPISRRGNKHFEEYQPYGRDTRDGEYEDFCMSGKKHKEKGRNKRK